MGQGISRKRTGIGKISEDKDGEHTVSVNGDVVNADAAKTEVNGSAVKINADQTVAETESETASAKKDKKKRKRFFFSLKRTRPGSGRKKKEKKDKQANHNTSVDGGKSNRSSLFMDEFQIPEDDGIDSVSLSSNEAENKKKNGDDVIRRSKRSSKDGKKGKKKKQKTEKKKGDKPKKKNSKDENETNVKAAAEATSSAAAATASADDSLNVNESVEPLHTSVEAAVDEAKAASQNTEVKNNEVAKVSEDDLVAAVTAVMDIKSPVQMSSEGVVSAAETSSSVDDEQTKCVEAVVNEEVIQPVEAVVQETAVSPENAQPSESSPSKVDDSANQSLDENGKPIRVSLGPRLKTAILKKYSGAGDVPPESQRVTLTKPKIVDVPDPIPPARKNRARRTLSQTPSNTSNTDLNTSTSSSISKSPLKESKSVGSEVHVTEVPASEVPANKVPATKITTGVISETVISTNSVSVANEVPITEMSESSYSKPGNEQSSTDQQSNKIEAVEQKKQDDPITLEEETTISQPEEANERTDQSNNYEEQSTKIPDETESRAETEKTETEPEASSGTTTTEIASGMTLAEQARVVVQQVIERSTTSLTEADLKTPTEVEDTETTTEKNAESSIEERDIPSVIEIPISKEEKSTVESSVKTGDNTSDVEEEKTIPLDSATDKEDTNNDSGGFVLREMEIIVVGTRTYDEPEESLNKEKGEPVVIIERIHVEPYYGPEVPDEESTDTNTDTEMKKHKYSKETGEVCKECLCEDESEEKDTVPATETVSVEVHAQEEVTVQRDNETDVTQELPCNDVTDGLVASKSDAGDDSSSTATDSTVVEDDDPEKTLVVEENIEKFEEQVEVNANQGKESQQESEKMLTHLDNDQKAVTEESVKSEAPDKDKSVSVEAKDNEQESSEDEPPLGREFELKCEIDTENKSYEQDISENNNVRKELFISPEKTKDASITEKEIDPERLVQSEESLGVKE